MPLSLFSRLNTHPVREAANQVRTSLQYHLPTPQCVLAECCHLTLDLELLHTHQFASIPHPFLSTWCGATVCSLCSRWDYILLSPFLTTVASVCLPPPPSTQKWLTLLQSSGRADIMHDCYNHGNVPSNTDETAV